MEYKRLNIEAAQIKMDGKAHTFEGYASTFNGVDEYNDTVVPGAFEETLTNRDRPVRMRWNHYGPVIGKWVELQEDDTGLRVRGELTPGHSVASDVYASLKHKAVDGLSIGYRVQDFRVEDEIRYLDKIELVEISVVEEPADLGAAVGQVKHMQEMINQAESLKEIETLLREAGGFSRAAATMLVSRVKALALGEREPNSAQSYLVERLEHLKIG